ncbi:MAG: hypothetical protein AAF629_28540 [Chloroflexota bacterium]
MNPPKRFSAILTYLLLVIGWAYVLILDRKNEFAIYHTRQSIMLVIVAIGSFIAWVIFAWLISLLPLVGPFVAASTFSLVISVLIAVVYGWIVGVIHALRAQWKPIPFFGGWANRLPIK